MPKRFYQRKRLWFSLLLLALLVGFLLWLISNPVGNFRSSVNVLLKLYGIEEKTVRFGRQTLRYYEGGTEHPRAVILLHGFGGNAQLTWMRLMPSLVRKYRVIAPNMLASNFLRLNPRTYSVDSEADLTLGLMQALGIEKADFVGLSVGGWVSLILALEHPEKVHSLILVESAGLMTEVPELARLTLTDRSAARRFFGLLFHNPPPLPGFVIDQLVKSSTAIKSKYEAVFAGFIENSKGRLLDDRVFQVQQPTLIVHGREDRVIPLQVAERLHQSIPHSQFIVLEGSGHAPVWDQPRKLKRVILDFLAAQPE